MKHAGLLCGLVALLAVATPSSSPLAGAAAPAPAPVGAPVGAAARLIGVLLGPSPLEADLRRLTDEIGGRMSGTEANRRPIERKNSDKARQPHVGTTDGGTSRARCKGLSGPGIGPLFGA